MAIAFSEEYWLVMLPYRGDLGLKDRREQRKVDHQKVTEAGFRSEYRFPNEKRARATAQLIKNKTGVIMSVGKAFGVYI